MPRSHIIKLSAYQIRRIEELVRERHRPEEPGEPSVEIFHPMENPKVVTVRFAEGWASVWETGSTDFRRYDEGNDGS